MNPLILIAAALTLYGIFQALKALARHSRDHQAALARDQLRAWRQEQRRGWKVTHPEERPYQQPYLGIEKAQMPEFVQAPQRRKAKC